MLEQVSQAGHQRVRAAAQKGREEASDKAVLCVMALCHQLAKAAAGRPTQGTAATWP
eukprot:CAMPEP_0204152558 /NCGR_PEP_ID=MMETSP0361-20130328/27119_1 /ASSEMBLY_ACC=CAM_ASM_000343 /TAXON_ID=268821 /ORGANISM="Scrippsiella Hangoei, Strain SHTV-5" /LENGTH=56 /DNA_ID=CAMNT_0051107541 /DNA_START=601 /DNA_END=768 /DNA_ORIENTATION=-